MATTTTKNNETTVLVTGATGTVGSEVVKQLTSSSSSSSGSRVRAAVHSKNKADELKNENKTIEIVNMDYNKPETIVKALNEVDKIFLVTPPAPNMNELSSSLINEAKKNNIKHIVKLSVLDADAEPGILIGRWHRREEKNIEESGIPYTFLRSGAFMQNFINYFGQTIKTQDTFYVPARDVKTSFVDVRDIAAVATEILLNKNESKSKQQYENKKYGITGSDALSYSQAAEILSKALGRKISYVNITEEDARKSMKNSGMENLFVDALIEIYNVIEPGNASQTIGAVEQITGRKPISFEQFVRDYASFFN